MTETTSTPVPATNNALAYVLWVIVGSALAYGIGMTAVKAVALFSA